MPYHRLFKSLRFAVMLVTAVMLLICETPAAVRASEQPPAVPTYGQYLSEHTAGAANVMDLTVGARDYTDAEDVRADGDYLYTGDSSFVTYAFDVPESGMYNITVTYKAISGGIGITRALYIDGAMPFAEAGNLVFERFYRDANQNYKTQQGNQTFPAQREVEVWREKTLCSANGYITEPFMFYLEKGERSITLEAVDSAMLIASVTLSPAREVPSYDEYAAAMLSSGARKITDAKPVKVQAEDASLKTSPSLFPINDRSSALMEPYHPSYIVLNAIGGVVWSTPGQLIEWEVTVPESGLYRVAFKAKQAVNRGMFSTRRLRVNGEVPFKEAGDLRYRYDTDYSLNYIGDGEIDYYIYLEEGVNTISLEAVLGVFGDLTSRVEQSLLNLNAAYRDIIVITGTTPDKYRDYQLHIIIPDLFPRLLRERNNLAAIVEDINAISGDYALSTTILSRLIVNLDKIIKSPLDIAIYITELKGSITALGDWMVGIQDQPLTIDYFIVAPEGYALPRAKDNFLEGSWHNIQAFLGSFTNKFNSSSVSAANGKTIEVWLSTGRDQFQILQRLVNESFTPVYGINVDLKLVGAEVVFPATLTGRGPDVSIQLAASTPINFGYRDGAYDLRQFADFDEVAGRFLPAAIESFTYKGKTYALPDQMSFPVMFYRTDIFNELGLSLPTTLSEFLSIVPRLQQSNMDIYFTTVPQTTLGASSASGSQKNVNPVYVSLLYQNGGELYYNEGERSAITSDIGVAAFKQWTELFTKHGFLVEADFVTRFRMGEIPVGIVDFTVYNTLAAAAPEILGDWAIAQVPGIMRDGILHREVPLTLSGAIIVKNTVERKETVDEAWEFLKWWTSAETQYNFARDMEAVLGLAGRYPVANLEAFDRIDWGKENLKVLKEAMEWVRAVPQVPGSYITGRAIENAFLSVVTSTNMNPTDVIHQAEDQINRELTSKRKEFGITD